MRGYDVAIVRLLPFVLFIQVGIYLISALNNIYFDDFCLLHGNSAIYATALYFISLANRHYHCVWNRAMYLFLIFTPVLNYLDAKIGLFDSVETYLWFISIIYILTAIITAYMAVKHFIPTLKHK